MIKGILAKEDYFWLVCEETSDVIVIDKSSQQVISAVPTDESVRALFRVDKVIWTSAGTYLYTWDSDSFDSLLKLESGHKETIYKILPLTNGLFATISAHSINIWKYLCSSPDK